MMPDESNTFASSIIVQTFHRSPTVSGAKLSNILKIDANYFSFFIINVTQYIQQAVKLMQKLLDSRQISCFFIFGWFCPDKLYKLFIIR